MPSFRDKLIRGKALSVIAVAAITPASQPLSPDRPYSHRIIEDYFDRAMESAMTELLHQEDMSMRPTSPSRLTPEQELEAARYGLVTDDQGAPVSYPSWHPLSS